MRMRVTSSITNIKLYEESKQIYAAIYIEGVTPQSLPVQCQCVTLQSLPLQRQCVTPQS